jgi:hypothetical protein
MAGRDTSGTLQSPHVNTPVSQSSPLAPPIVSTIDAIRDDAQARGLVFVEFNENGRMYHEPTCPATTERMQRVKRADARDQGYLPAWDCHKPQ